ncbi:UNVERIFIED_CONTAM: hypothetical protein HHA_235660 [Hammondia hammondi]|eukprot:XP_008885533.1 hypothetical protein HHA_235660 [Hammondia hammondi]
MATDHRLCFSFFLLALLLSCSLKQFSSFSSLSTSSDAASLSPFSLCLGAQGASAVEQTSNSADEDDDEDEFIYQDAPATQAPSTGEHSGAQTAGGTQEKEASRSPSRPGRVPQEKSYVPEALFACTLVLVIVVAYWGKNQNVKVADAWIASVAPFLKENFAVVGYENSYLVMKAYNIFELYCTGRRNCFYLHGVLQCLPRQCLWRYFVLHPLFRSRADDAANSVTLEVLLPPSSEPSVVALCKRTEQKQLMNNNWDLREFAKARSASSNPKLGQLGATLQAFSDTIEALDAVILGNKTIIKTLSSCMEHFRFLYLSDICSSLHPSTLATAAACPAAAAPGASASNRNRRVLRISFFLPPVDRMAEVEPLLRLALFMADQSRHLGLSDKSIEVAKKMRQQYQKEMLKEQEEQRLEQLEKRRSEKKRQDEEKYEKMTPEQQRKYEEKEYKKSLKQRGRFKVLKV